MRFLVTGALVFITLMAVSAHSQQSDAKKLKDQLTGDAKAAASANPQCKLFTSAEISAYVGAKLGAGENAAGGSGCIWGDEDGEASALVQVVPANYFPEPSLVKGFKRLPGIGSKAWVAPESGWSAGAVVQDEAIVVELSGAKASEESVIALLQEAIKRRKK